MEIKQHDTFQLRQQYGGNRVYVYVTYIEHDMVYFFSLYGNNTYRGVARKSDFLDSFRHGQIEAVKSEYQSTMIRERIHREIEGRFFGRKPEKMIRSVEIDDPEFGRGVVIYKDDKIIAALFPFTAVRETRNIREIDPREKMIDMSTVLSYAVITPAAGAAFNMYMSEKQYKAAVDRGVAKLKSKLKSHFLKIEGKVGRRTLEPGDIVRRINEKTAEHLLYSRSINFQNIIRSSQRSTTEYTTRASEVFDFMYNLAKSRQRKVELIPLSTYAQFAGVPATFDDVSKAIRDAIIEAKKNDVTRVPGGLPAAFIREENIFSIIEEPKKEPFSSFLGEEVEEKIRNRKATLKKEYLTSFQDSQEKIYRELILDDIEPSKKNVLKVGDIVIVPRQARYMSQELEMGLYRVLGFHKDDLHSILLSPLSPTYSLKDEFVQIITTQGERELKNFIQRSMVVVESSVEKEFKKYRYLDLARREYERVLGSYEDFKRLYERYSESIRGQRKSVTVEDILGEKSFNRLLYYHRELSKLGEPEGRILINRILEDFSLYKSVIEDLDAAISSRKINVLEADVLYRQMRTIVSDWISKLEDANMSYKMLSKDAREPKFWEKTLNISFKVQNEEIKESIRLIQGRPWMTVADIKKMFRREVFKNMKTSDIMKIMEAEGIISFEEVKNFLKKRNLSAESIFQLTATHLGGDITESIRTLLGYEGIGGRMADFVEEIADFDEAKRMGDEMHRRINEVVRRAAELKPSKFGTYEIIDREVYRETSGAGKFAGEITGKYDVKVKINGEDVIIDLKTLTSAESLRHIPNEATIKNIAEVDALPNRIRKHVSQLNFYLNQHGVEKGYLLYVVQKDPSLLQDVDFKILEITRMPELLERDIQNVVNARQIIFDYIYGGGVPPEGIKNLIDKAIPQGFDSSHLNLNVIGAAIYDKYVSLSPSEVRKGLIRESIVYDTLAEIGRNSPEYKMLSDKITATIKDLIDKRNEIFSVDVAGAVKLDERIRRILEGYKTKYRPLARMGFVQEDAKVIESLEAIFNASKAHGLSVVYMNLEYPIDPLDIHSRRVGRMVHSDGIRIGVFYKGKVSLEQAKEYLIQGRVDNPEAGMYIMEFPIRRGLVDVRKGVPYMLRTESHNVFSSRLRSLRLPESAAHLLRNVIVGDEFSLQQMFAVTYVANVEKLAEFLKDSKRSTYAVAKLNTELQKLFVGIKEEDAAEAASSIGLHRIYQSGYHMSIADLFTMRKVISEPDIDKIVENIANGDVIRGQIEYMTQYLSRFGHTLGLPHSALRKGFILPETPLDLMVYKTAKENVPRQIWNREALNVEAIKSRLADQFRRGGKPRDGISAIPYVMTNKMWDVLETKLVNLDAVYMNSLIIKDVTGECFKGLIDRGIDPNLTVGTFENTIIMSKEAAEALPSWQLSRVRVPFKGVEGRIKWSKQFEEVIREYDETGIVKPVEVKPGRVLDIATVNSVDRYVVFGDHVRLTSDEINVKFESNLPGRLHRIVKSKDEYIFEFLLDADLKNHDKLFVGYTKGTVRQFERKTIHDWLQRRFPDLYEHLKKTDSLPDIIYFTREEGEMLEGRLQRAIRYARDNKKMDLVMRAIRNHFDENSVEFRDISSIYNPYKPKPGGEMTEELVEIIRKEIEKRPSIKKIIGENITTDKIEDLYNERFDRFGIKSERQMRRIMKFVQKIKERGSIEVLGLSIASKKNILTPQLVLDVERAVGLADIWKNVSSETGAVLQVADEKYWGVPMVSSVARAVETPPPAGWAKFNWHDIAILKRISPATAKELIEQIELPEEAIESIKALNIALVGDDIATASSMYTNLISEAKDATHYLGKSKEEIRAATGLLKLPEPISLRGMYEDLKEIGKKVMDDVNFLTENVHSYVYLPSYAEMSILPEGTRPLERFKEDIITKAINWQQAINAGRSAKEIMEYKREFEVVYADFLRTAAKELFTDKNSIFNRALKIEARGSTTGKVAIFHRLTTEHPENMYGTVQMTYEQIAEATQLPLNYLKEMARKGGADFRFYGFIKRNPTDRPTSLIEVAIRPIDSKKVPEASEKMMYLSEDVMMAINADTDGDRAIVLFSDIGKGSIEERMKTFEAGQLRFKQMWPRIMAKRRQWGEQAIRYYGKKYETFKSVAEHLFKFMQIIEGDGGERAIQMCDIYNALTGYVFNKISDINQAMAIMYSGELTESVARMLSADAQGIFNPMAPHMQVIERIETTEAILAKINNMFTAAKHGDGTRGLELIRALELGKLYPHGTPGKSRFVAAADEKSFLELARESKLFASADTLTLFQDLNKEGIVLEKEIEEKVMSTLEDLYTFGLSPSAIKNETLNRIARGNIGRTGNAFENMALVARTLSGEGIAPGTALSDMSMALGVYSVHADDMRRIMDLREMERKIVSRRPVDMIMPTIGEKFLSERIAPTTLRYVLEIPNVVAAVGGVLATAIVVGAFGKQDPVDLGTFRRGLPAPDGEIVSQTTELKMDIPEQLLPAFQRMNISISGKNLGVLSNDEIDAIVDNAMMQIMDYGPVSKKKIVRSFNEPIDVKYRREIPRYARMWQ